MSWQLPGPPGRQAHMYNTWSYHLHNLEREYRDCITQYGSTVYIGIAMGGPAL